MRIQTLAYNKGTQVPSNLQFRLVSVHFTTFHTLRDQQTNFSVNLEASDKVLWLSTK